MGAPQYRRRIQCVCYTQAPLGPDEPGPDELSGRLGRELPHRTAQIWTLPPAQLESLLMSHGFQISESRVLVILFVSSLPSRGMAHSRPKLSLCVCVQQRPHGEFSILRWLSSTLSQTGAMNVHPYRSSRCPVYLGHLGKPTFMEHGRGCCLHAPILHMGPDAESVPSSLGTMIPGPLCT